MTLTSAPGCAVFNLTHPSTPAESDPSPLVASSPQAPVQSVSVSFDDKGVPSIFARSDIDASYALGFLHARDRSFQLELLRHAAHGRLTEVFGPAYVEVDRQLRLLGYAIDDQVNALTAADRALAEAYVFGLNDALEDGSRTAEMHILGRDVLPFTVKDVVAISRLYAWERSHGLNEELVRTRIITRMPEGDARREALLLPVGGKGASVLSPRFVDVTQPEPAADAGVVDDDTPKNIPVIIEVAPDGGVPDTDGGVPDSDGGVLDAAPAVDDTPAPTSTPLPLSPSTRNTTPQTDTQTHAHPAAPKESLQAVRKRARQRQRSEHQRHSVEVQTLLAQLGLSSKSGSNAFVVDGSLTASSKPVLVADPHFRHTSPPVYYSVRLHVGKDVHASGVTLPGMPFIVMGATQHMSWALTGSFVDTIDLVRIEREPSDPRAYLVGGKRYTFGRTDQRYLSQGQAILTEETLSTVFGPVLPKGYEHLLEPSEDLAVLWTGFDKDANKNNISAMWSLLRATSVADAEAAADQVGAPTENMLMAFTSGDIAYRLMGRIPRRRSAAPTDRPRDGRSLDAGWQGAAAHNARPKLDNPPWHFIVTANQRIAPDGYPTLEVLGRSGDLPHRARRLTDRLQALTGRSSADALLSLQMDVKSLQADDLSAALGAVCPTSLDGFDDKRVKALCDGLTTFDGMYWRDSLGALVFTRTLDALFEEVLATHMGPDIGRQLLKDPAVVFALERAVLQEHQARVAKDDSVGSPLFDDRRTSHREGLAGFMRRAVVIALDTIDDELGKEPRNWTWGKVHTLQVNGPLSDTALVGWTFVGVRTQQDGHSTCVRAESGTPIVTGAALRMAADMKDTPEVSLVLDLGQSGHRFHDHERDQFGEWNSALPIFRNVVPGDTRLKTTGKLLLVPAALNP